jgi:hypothetical protein
MKSAAKKVAHKPATPAARRAAPQAKSTKRTSAAVMERVVLASPLKPRHLTYAQIRRMVAKVAPGPVIVPR